MESRRGRSLVVTSQWDPRVTSSAAPSRGSSYSADCTVLTLQSLTLASLYIDGAYVGQHDRELLEKIHEDLELFVERLSLEKHRVLVFPALNSRCRFLTHKAVEHHTQLSSFSIGSGSRRRTVVCHQDLRRIKQESCVTEWSTHSDYFRSKPQHTSARAAPVRTGCTSGGRGGMTSRKSAGKPARGRPKRPDIALYVPRARRHEGVAENEESGCSGGDALEETGGVCTQLGDDAPGAATKRLSSKTAASQRAGHRSAALGHGDVVGRSAALHGRGTPGSSSAVTLTQSASVETVNVGSGTDLECTAFVNCTNEDSSVQGHNENDVIAAVSVPPNVLQISNDEVSSVELLERCFRAGHMPENVDTADETRFESNRQSDAKVWGNRDITNTRVAVPRAGAPTQRDYDGGDTKPVPRGNCSGSSTEPQETDFQGSRCPKAQSEIDSGSCEKQVVAAEPEDSPNSPVITINEDSNDNHKSPSDTLAEAVVPALPLSLVEELESSCVLGACDARDAAGVPSPAAVPCNATSPGMAIGGMSGGDGDEEDGWDSKFDDSGECLDEQLKQELAANLMQEEVLLQEPQFDYYGYRPAEPSWDDGDFGHVIEIYNFPSGFRTEDLISAFSSFQSRGFDVKWVDDEHALGLFSSPVAARDALAMKHALVKTRPLSQASQPSRDKARHNPEFLQPVRPRPQTSAMLARRLVTGALGVRSGASPEQRSAERRKLQEAKDKKKLVAKQREDIWEGSV